MLSNHFLWDNLCWHGVKCFLARPPNNVLLASSLLALAENNMSSCLRAPASCCCVSCLLEQFPMCYPDLRPRHTSADNISSRKKCLTPHTRYRYKKSYSSVGEIENIYLLKLWLWVLYNQILGPSVQVISVYFALPLAWLSFNCTWVLLILAIKHLGSIINYLLVVLVSTSIKSQVWISNEIMPRAIRIG